MIDGFVRLLIVVVTLGIAWNATGDVMAAAWQADPWKGYAGALGVELVLAYAIFKVAKSANKAVFGMMILVFGAVSIAAQILHAWAFGKPLPVEITETLPVQITWAWRYLLPAVPTLAGMTVGLLDVAEKSGFKENEFLKLVSDKIDGLRAKPVAETKVMATEVDALPLAEKPRQ